MTRKEFLQTLGIGAATISVASLPGSSLLHAAEADTAKANLPKNAERLSFGLPDQRCCGLSRRLLSVRVHGALFTLRIASNIPHLCK